MRQRQRQSHTDSLGQVKGVGKLHVWGVAKVKRKVKVGMGTQRQSVVCVWWWYAGTQGQACV